MATRSTPPTRRATAKTSSRAPGAKRPAAVPAKLPPAASSAKVAAEVPAPGDNWARADFLAWR